MFLSFWVPVYNGETYLRECLDALLDQDLTDYEILCVDDSSTDGSSSILRQYAQAHPWIRIFTGSIPAPRRPVPATKLCPGG